MSRPIRTILAGVATVSGEDPAIEPSLRLAERLDAALHLVHVGEGGDGKEGESARARLESDVAAAGGDPARVRCVSVEGDPAEVLPKMATEVGADLLVLGTTRRGWVAGAVMGTTAGGVLRAARVPVLVLRKPVTAITGRIVLATDLTGHSAHALRVGLPLARQLREKEGEERVVFVTGPDYGAELAHGEFASSEKALPELERFLAEALPGENLQPVARVGNTARELVDDAGQWEADLIVLGTHGRSGAKRFFLGSVAEEVLRNTPCSALVIPPAAIPGDGVEAEAA